MSRFLKWSNVVCSALGALLAALAFPTLAADPTKCRLVQIVEWPVSFIREHPVIDGSINGKRIGVLLDTGAELSLVMNAAAQRLGLAKSGDLGSIVGIGGESSLRATQIGELRIGQWIRKDLTVRVGGERPIPGVDLVLGNDFFNQFDIEFDYAKRVVRLFEPHDCRGVFLAYWDSTALELPMKRARHIVVPVKINGREARALIDSGATISIVGLSLAEELGITPKTPGVVPSGCSSGFGRNIVPSWVARFDALEIGGQTIRNPRLRVMDLPDMDNDIILGTDFLRTHRILVSRTQRKVYLSYIGGLIFPAIPALDCDERLREGRESEALAAYDQAITKNSSDTKALLHRAVLRARKNDANGALADLDAVIRLEPGNAVALNLRSGVRATLKDYEGALEDSSAAIANGMRTAQMYMSRAWLRHAQGDSTRAIEEYDEALKLDPRHQGALHARAYNLFYAGRFEAAENDFAALLAVRPSGFDSIWLYLSRARRGLEGNAMLEEGVAKLKSGQWPAPILQFLLGRLDDEALITAAANVDESKRKNQECEARFYMAVRLITLGKNGAARPLLEKARDECPRDYIEYEAALAELKKFDSVTAR